MLKWTAAVFAIAGLSHGATTPSSTQLRRTKTSPTLTPFPQGRVQLSTPIHKYDDVLNGL